MGIVVRRNGDVIVTEYENHRLKIFSQQNLGESKTIGARRVGAGKFACPRGVALDQNDNILVADSLNHRIQAISLTGEPLGSFGTIGLDPGCLDTPYDVAMDTAGNIVVADTKNHRLQVFTRLVPVYAEPAMYDEEYETAAVIDDEEGLGMNGDEIPGNDLDKELQNYLSDVQANEKPQGVAVQENNSEDRKENTGSPNVQGKANIAETANNENLTGEQSKDGSVGNQELDVNDNQWRNKNKIKLQADCLLKNPISRLSIS